MMTRKEELLKWASIKASFHAGKVALFNRIQSFVNEVVYYDLIELRTAPAIVTDNSNVIAYKEILKENGLWFLRGDVICRTSAVQVDELQIHLENICEYRIITKKDLPLYVNYTYKSPLYYRMLEDADET